jgi:hypothetical protein
MTQLGALVRFTRGLSIVAALAASIVVSGCNGGSSSTDARKDVPTSPDLGSAGSGGGGPDGGGADKPPVCGDAGARKLPGEACSCASDCQSAFCVDGVCCDTACTGTCMACNTQESMGTCAPVPKGQKPRLATTCAASDVSTCGLDGTCDGAGACRKYPVGTECVAGACEGDAVTNRKVCDEAGQCSKGDDIVCVPSSCDTTKKACVDKCKSNSECAAGHTCVNGSCGPKMKGARCEKNDDCASGFCADGVCCADACQGGCTSCNQVGREGTCWPVDEGNKDPHGVCKDSGPTMCGQTGTCDGFGGCSMYGTQTVCVPPSCAGDRLNTAGTCDGMGTCKPPGVQDCPPFRCAAGACNTVCKSDADCVAGIACVNGSCGKRQDGNTCTMNADCKSNFCVDGVCCNEACGGACRSCGLAASRGKCTMLPAGNTDSRNMCKDQGAASCGNDGRCDGAGACRKYRSGTVCAGEKCASNVYTPPATCNTTGQCVAPATQACAPFACNGTKCFNACTVTANCSPGNVCNGNSCGKKLPGASCSANAECASNSCAQGVCCATTCNASCKSCNLPGSLGVCTNVATGLVDPKGLCLDQGAASCGNNGRCAAGACQKYAAGTKCKDSTCPANTVNFTGQSTCNGAGVCGTPATTSCFPFACGAAVCKSTCTANADCAPNATCINGSCGLKPKGAACNASAECGAGLVCSTREKVCCTTDCSGPCQSCTLAATLGTCSPVAAGANDPSGQCGVSAVSTCLNDGKCDGAGACRKYPAGTQCAPPSCPANMSTQTLAKTCNGAGLCNQGGGTRACSPFMCDGATSCRDTCTDSTQCVSPNTCVGNMCGKKGPGASCATTDQCAAGLFCTDGFCCNSGNCGACRACNATGMCQNADGDACTATDACHVSDGTCSGGMCQRASISCDDGNPCTADSCNPAVPGGCVHTGLTGMACNDNNACTQTDACNAQGACVGSNPITCTATDQCHMAGQCNQATGMCSNPPKTGGSCNDGDACTQTDTCSAQGTCVGGNPVVCPQPDQCHQTRVCDPGTGMCSNPPKGNGTQCDDGSECTQTDTCQSGTCVGGNPVVCPTADQCHQTRVCDPGTGQCSNNPKGNGTGCDDGNECTQTDTCQGGNCQGGNPVVCTGDPCHEPGVCNETSGNCSTGSVKVGDTCNDGNGCTSNDTCQNNGSCQGDPCPDGLLCDLDLGICL